MKLVITPVANIFFAGSNTPIPQFKGMIVKENGEKIHIYTGDNEAEAKDLFNYFVAFSALKKFETNNRINTGGIA